MPLTLSCNMWSIRYLLPLLSFLLHIHAQSDAINVADLPQCARGCLSNSTSVVATTCTSLNVACLCNSAQFVSTFYCCLSTQCNRTEQATAIQFNQQQCAAVNATAPDFVGCSPLKATSSTGGTVSATTYTPSNGGAYSTVASAVTEAASFSATKQVVVTYPSRSLLTGSCTVPFFALVSASGKADYFPEVGCAPDRPGCCPFDSTLNGVLAECPQDYFTTSGACCPIGYSVYSTTLGSETPCYSTPSAILVPATTPTISGLVITTDLVFSRQYNLRTVKSSGFPTGGIVGITVNAVLFICVIIAIVWYRRRKRRRQSLQTGRSTTTFPAEEPVLSSEPKSDLPQELSSVERAEVKHNSRSFWPFGNATSPSTHGSDKQVPKARTIPLQELPASTYINEHHPAFGGSETETEKTLRTPTRSPVTSLTASPALTPRPDTQNLRAVSPGAISPLGSPQFSRNTMARISADEHQTR